MLLSIGNNSSQWKGGKASLKSFSKTPEIRKYDICKTLTVLLTDLTVKLWGKINLKEACLWKHCCMGTKPWECSLRVIQGSCHNQNHHRQIASYFIFFFLLLTSPDNNIKVSDTTRKKVYMHIFTRVQAGTPQHQLPITAGPKRVRE